MLSKRLLVALLLSGVFQVTFSFTVVRQTTSSPRTTAVRRKMVGPEHLGDPLAWDSFLQHHEAVWQSTSHFLADAAAAVEQNSDGGWWQAYLQIFKNTLSAVHSTIDGPLRSVGIEQTWGISIFIFTAMIRSLLIPLSIQQSKSAEYIKALKPYMTEIKKKYKDNQDAQNRAIAKLYEDADQNPLAGCLVSLAQLPVFLGLYRGVRLLAKDGQLQEPFLWIPSLEGPVSPPTYQGLDWLLKGWTNTGDGFPTPSLGWETTLAFLAMPVILVVLQSVTMKTLQPAMDDDVSEEEKETMERTQGILKFLPLMIGFFSLQVPAGLTIYWVTSNLFTLTQSLAVRAYFAANPPQIELPEYWDSALREKNYEKMTPEERRKAAEAGMQIGPKFEEMVAEARFHCLIERRSFREETEAWKRAESASIPSELEEWVMSKEAARLNATATA